MIVVDKESASGVKVKCQERQEVKMSTANHNARDALKSRDFLTKEKSWQPRNLRAC